MKVMVLGGGGREHALAWKLRQSPAVEAVWALPGSDAIASVASCLGGDACDSLQVVAAVDQHAIDLTVVGPEAPLAAGVADELRRRGRWVLGPSRAAAQLESSKIFAKEFMARHGIASAPFAVVATPAQAERELRRFGYPVVLKADGLAGGKGVLVAQNEGEARSFAEAALSGELLGQAGRQLVIEACLRGPEVSVLAVCDGARVRLLPAARDHKRLLEGDRGPNTGGMGAYSTAGLLPPDLMEAIEQTIVQPTVDGMTAEGRPFQGVLYCGLMLTPAGPKVLEYNVRLGDPEAQAVLLRWQGDLAELLYATAQGRLPPARPDDVSPDAAACVVAASAGYPGQYARGESITGLEAAAQAGTVVFHAGTRRLDGGWETTGGRVLAVAARAPRLEQALASCYRGLEHIHFRGMQYRRDIGATAVEAPARSSHSN